MTAQRAIRLSLAACGLLVLFSGQKAYSYSVLTHEAIVDSTWDSAIKPLLLKRFHAFPCVRMMIGDCGLCRNLI